MNGAQLAEPPVKRCAKCGETKLVADFYMRSDDERWPRSACKSCSRRQLDTLQGDRNKWKRDHPEQYRQLRRVYRLKSQYGMTPDEWLEMFEGQGFACAACHSATPGGRGHWAVDHHHASGKVRGILCNSCNLALGQLQDDEGRILALLGYLQRSAR